MAFVKRPESDDDIVDGKKGSVEDRLAEVGLGRSGENEGKGFGAIRDTR